MHGPQNLRTANGFCKSIVAHLVELPRIHRYT
jgi:hypothetical protein